MPVWTEYIRDFFMSSVGDGISYVEPRVAFWYKYMYDADGREVVPHREWLTTFDRVLSEVKEELAKEGRQNEFVGAKVRYTSSRT